MKWKCIPRYLETFIPWTVFALLLAYTYAHLFVQPYLGFQLLVSRGEIFDVFVNATDEADLSIGDQILSFNGRVLDEYASDLRLPIFSNGNGLTSVEIQLLRQGKVLDITWSIPGFTTDEFLSRVLNIWLAGYLFWLAGTVTILLVRPKDNRRSLLSAFFYITAVWVVVGANSGMKIWEAPFVMRAAVWMSLPIYIHFHWNFPRAFKQIPNIAWWLLYLVGIAGATLQWLGILPKDFYFWPFAVATLSSALILLIRFIARPDERTELRLLFLAALVAFLPVIFAALADIQQTLTRTMPGLLFSLIALPGAYFYVVYRRQLGGLELRANRLISIFLYLVLLLTLIFAILPLVVNNFLAGQNTIGTTTALVLLTALGTVLGFNRFQRFVERRILNIPLTPDHLVEGFARKIATSITPKHLVRVLKEEVLPSLLIRQSALIQIDEDLGSDVLYKEGLNSKQIPGEQDIQRLLKRSGKTFKPLSAPSEIAQTTNWVHLALPLVVGEQITGIWLLGRRDPDDHYSYAVTSVLTSLADQTAIALTNITQAKQLRALYQIDIERQELARTHLARELHDDVLNRFAELKLQLGKQALTEEFELNYQHLVDYLRATIHGLRPPMLSYGLHAGLSELVDDLNHRSGASPTIQVAVPASQSRVDQKVEQHLYRIIQQSLDNALRHAQAQSIEISGTISEDQIDLTVQDDGRGFDLEQDLDLVALLANRHFGLASMSERAALVGADLNIETSPRKGTKINISWTQSSQ